MNLSPASSSSRRLTLPLLMHGIPEPLPPDGQPPIEPPPIEPGRPVPEPPDQPLPPARPPVDTPVEPPPSPAPSPVTDPSPGQLPDHIIITAPDRSMRESMCRAVHRPRGQHPVMIAKRMPAPTRLMSRSLN